MATFYLKDIVKDEIEQYLSGRFMNSNESIWRILRNNIAHHYPSITCLDVHLENGERVAFDEKTAHLIIEAPVKTTTLTAFFELNQKDKNAQTLLYCEVPKHYVWNQISNHHKWTKRKSKSRDTLSRVYGVHHKHSECFYLRLLLFHVRGPKSFEDLRMIDQRICSTYQEACKERGLLADDAHWDATLKEDIVFKFPNTLRNLFSLLLQQRVISSPLILWEKYKENFAEDILNQHRVINPNLQYNDIIFNEVLLLIEDKVISLGGEMLEEYGFKNITRTRRNISPLLAREINYNTKELEKIIKENVPKLTMDQKNPFFEISKVATAKKGGLFFIDAPGGTGKTFLLNLLLAHQRMKKNIALAVASSGIAATLLEGGRTAHSTFKLPLDVANSDDPMCNIAKESALANVLQKCSIIVWDECTMTHKANLEAVNRTLQYLRGNKKLMGGVTFVMAGDFRQTLPIVDRGTRANEIDACIKESILWQNVTRKFKLTTNMRVHLGQADGNAVNRFSTSLLRLGNGEVTSDEDGQIEMKEFGNVVESLEVLITSIFPDLTQRYNSWPKFTYQWFSGRAILAPKNDIVEKINVHLLQQIPTGDGFHYKSIDTITDPSVAVQFPPEYLNTIDMPGVPPHNLHLKPGVPIMLLRNLDPPKLCNGTRMIVNKLRKHLIEAVILDGKFQKEHVFIPRVPIIPNKLPFSFKRLQFPVRLSFAMTINKSQGQTLKKAGIDLTLPCFSHGQLYVGCSRVGTQDNLFILAPNGRSTNIVYPEALY